MLKQIRETELFKHVMRYLTSVSLLCHNVAPLDYKDGLAEIATDICCQGAELLNGKIWLSNGFCCKPTNVEHLKADNKEPVTMVSGTAITDGNKQRVDVLIPSSQIDPLSSNSDRNSCCRVHPSLADGLTVLLFALPQDTWLGLKEEKLQAEMKGLTSVDSLPILLQEEVMSASCFFFPLKFLVFPFFFNHFECLIVSIIIKITILATNGRSQILANSSCNFGYRNQFSWSCILVE